MAALPPDGAVPAGIDRVPEVSVVAVSGPGPAATVDVFLILTDLEGRVLLGLRAAHLYGGGWWALVSGKAEPGEDVVTAMIREAREEVGLGLGRHFLRPAVVVHYGNAGQAGHGPRVGFGFRVTCRPDRHGPVANREPDKCDALSWFPLDRLPQPLEPFTAVILDAAATGLAFTTADWPRPQPGPTVTAVVCLGTPTSEPGAEGGPLVVNYPILVDARQVGQIGYSVHDGHTWPHVEIRDEQDRGHGYARQAAALFLAELATLSLPPPRVMIRPWNQPSLALAHAAGFTLVHRDADNVILAPASPPSHR